MRIRIDNKASIVLILMAGASLVSMLGTLRIDSIINHDLYNYGLQFSTKWAVPYWTTAGIVFSMGWLIILTAIAFELHLVKQWLHKRSKPETPTVCQEPVQTETPRIEAEQNIPEETTQNETPNETPMTEPEQNVSEEPVQTETPIMEPEQDIPEETTQNETPIMESEPNTKPEEKKVITTALAVKKEEKDDLLEFRVLLEEISVMTSATTARQKTDEKPKT